MEKLQDQVTVQEADVKKRAYKAPQLTNLGKLSELTHGTSSKTNDPGGPQNGKN